MADKKERAKRAVNNRRNKTSSTTSSRKPTTTGYSASQSNVQLPKVDFTQEPQANISIDSTVAYNPNGLSDVAIPNIPNYTLNDVAQKTRLPEFQEITDITNPGIKNTVSESQFNKAKNQYEGGIRYEQLSQLHSKYVAEQWKSLSEAYKAYSQGLIALSSLEKVKQQFIEVLKQQSVTQEKISLYVAQASKTATTQAKLPYEVAINEAELSETKSKAQKAFHKAKNANQEALDFINGLGTQNENSSASSK